MESIEPTACARFLPLLHIRYDFVAILESILLFITFGRCMTMLFISVYPHRIFIYHFMSTSILRVCISFFPLNFCFFLFTPEPKTFWFFILFFVFFTYYFCISQHPCWGSCTGRSNDSLSIVRFCPLRLIQLLSPLKFLFGLCLATCTTCVMKP